MADLLIRGLEMPRVCANCFACKYDRDSGLSACNISGCVLMFASMMKRDKDCPLVELPDHGRLIDAEVLKETINYYIREAGWSTEINTALKWCKEFIDAENTIIPASKEGES